MKKEITVNGGGGHEDNRSYVCDKCGMIIWSDEGDTWEYVYWIDKNSFCRDCYEGILDDHDCGSWCGDGCNVCASVTDKRNYGKEIVL